MRGVVSNFRDVHQRKIAEDEAASAKKLLTTISENVVDGIFFGIPGQEFQYVNNAFLEISGYKSIGELKKIKPHHLFFERGLLPLSGERRHHRERPRVDNQASRAFWRRGKTS